MGVKCTVKLVTNLLVRQVQTTYDGLTAEKNMQFLTGSIQPRGLISSLGLFLLIIALLAAPNASATLLTWDVDPTNSYIRLTIPDQSMYVTNLGNVTVKIRDAGDNDHWTDAGGRRAAIGGKIVTDYMDGCSITFLGGTHNLYCLENTNLRPDPDEWDAVATNYTGTSTAPAALGGRGRATYVVIILPVTVDVAYLAFRNMRLDITNTTAGAIAINNGTFTANTTCFGIASALVDVDGLDIAGLGQPVPDIYHEQMGRIVVTNAAGGTITNLGGLTRRLTYTVSMPNLSFDFGGSLVTGSVTGSVVATTVLPPTLTGRKVGDAIVLSWTTNATGYALEYTTSLPSANWLPASPAPVIVGDQNVVTNAMTPNAMFYRLRKQ